MYEFIRLRFILSSPVTFSGRMPEFSAAAVAVDDDDDDDDTLVQSITAAQSSIEVHNNI